jgi:hypothetical protein
MDQKDTQTATSGSYRSSHKTSGKPCYKGSFIYLNIYESFGKFQALQKARNRTVVLLFERKQNHSYL